MSPSGTSALQDEVLEVARRLIRIDTTNGNETEAAEYLADYLRDAVRGTPAEGRLQVELVARDPRRANLVARLPAEESLAQAEESLPLAEESLARAEESLARA